jgi:UDP-3-O-acyl-N-acetylglucosamine deacetylase
VGSGGSGGDLVLFLVDKVVVRVKVQLREEALADELVRHLALDLLDDLVRVGVRVRVRVRVRVLGLGLGLGSGPSHLEHHVVGP